LLQLLLTFQLTLNDRMENVATAIPDLPSSSRIDELAVLLFPPFVGDGFAAGRLLVVDSSRESSAQPAELLAQAELELEAEDSENALRLSALAESRFVALGDAQGMVDSKRLAIHSFRFQGRFDFASQIAREERLLCQEKGDESGEAKMLLAVAELSLARRTAQSLEEAELLAKQARDMFREQEDPKNEGLALLVLSDVSLKLSSMAGSSRSSAQRAREAACDALECFQELELHREVGRALLALAAAAAAGQDFQEVSRAAGKALEVFRFCGDQRWEAFALLSLARWQLEEDNAEQAIRNAEAGLQLLQRLSCTRSARQAAAICVAVQAQVAVGEPKKALGLVGSGLAQFRGNGDKDAEGRLLFGAAIAAHLAEGDLAAALQSANKALVIFRELADRKMEALLLRVQSILKLKGTSVGKAAPGCAASAEALASAKAALDAAQRLGDEEEEGLAWLQLAHVRSRRGEPTNALKAAQTGRELFRRACNATLEAKSLMESAQLSLKGRDFQAAGNFGFQAQKLYHESGDRKGEASALVMLASVQLYREDFPKAMNAAFKACDLSEEIGDRRSQADALVLVSQAGQRRFLEAPGEQGVFEAALKASAEATLLARRLQDECLLATALLSTAQLKVLDPQPSSLLQALQLSEEAIQKWRELGDLGSEACSLDVKAHALLLRGQEDEAVLAMEDAKTAYQKASLPEGEEHCKEVLRMWGRQSHGPTAIGAGSKGEDEAAAIVPMQPREKKDLSGLAGTDLVRAQVREMIVQLGVDEEGLEDDGGLMSAGLTSRSAIHLGTVLRTSFDGIRFPSTLSFDCPSISTLSDWINEEIAKSAAG